MSQGNNNTKKSDNVPSHWAQIMGEIVNKLSGTNMSTNITFDNLEIDVPRAKGPDGKDIGSAKWIVNGTIRWTTTASKKE
ncbi:MAG TPA: hypothetical protein VJ729_13725 [Nitrososphaeraceae archaeon]|jgi:hypothetical protein|nr:hypothetical protein [Nitrososphaeraceae archaeon]